MSDSLRSSEQTLAEFNLYRIRETKTSNRSEENLNGLLDEGAHRRFCYKEANPFDFSAVSCVFNVTAPTTLTIQITAEKRIRFLSLFGYFSYIYTNTQKCEKCRSFLFSFANSSSFFVLMLSTGLRFAGMCQVLLINLKCYI